LFGDADADALSPSRAGAGIDDADDRRLADRLNGQPRHDLGDGAFVARADRGGVSDARAGLTPQQPVEQGWLRRAEKIGLSETKRGRDAIGERSAADQFVLRVVELCVAVVEIRLRGRTLDDARDGAVDLDCRGGAKYLRGADRDDQATEQKDADDRRGENFMLDRKAEIVEQARAKIAAGVFQLQR
jgi:hypothetical protein